MAGTALLVLDLTGTFAFALNGALTALRATRLDIVGVVTLGMITALGGGTIRDVFLDSLPPATFLDWRYLAVAARRSGGCDHRNAVHHVISLHLASRRASSSLRTLRSAAEGLP